MSDRNTAQQFGSGAADDPPPRAASDAAATMRDEVSEAVGSAAQAQKDRAAEGVSHAAAAAHDAARRLQRDEAWMAGLVDRASDGLADLADALRRNDLRTLVERAERFARDQPVLFTGASFALGFILARTARAGLNAGQPYTTAGENGHER